MCLSVVERTIPKRIMKKKFAWKVFGVDSVGNIFPEYAYQGRSSYVVGKWNEAQGGHDLGAGEVPYPYGFHCFVEKAVAKRWCAPLELIRRVQIRNIVAFGGQHVGPGRKAAPVLVAREMRILPEAETTTAFGRLFRRLRRFLKGERA